MLGEFGSRTWEKRERKEGKWGEGRTGGVKEKSVGE